MPDHPSNTGCAWERHSGSADALLRTVLMGPGETETTVRAAAAGTVDLPEPIGDFVAAVREHSYRITDSDVRSLKERGFAEDEIFELTVAAALGRAFRGLAAGLEAMGRST